MMAMMASVALGQRQKPGASPGPPRYLGQLPLLSQREGLEMEQPEYKSLHIKDSVVIGSNFINYATMPALEDTSYIQVSTPFD